MEKEVNPIVLVMYVIEKLIRQMNFFSENFGEQFIYCVYG